MQSGRLRFLLILALLASNLLVGVLSLAFLHAMDQRYATLLDRSVRPINGLRTLTRELSVVQRLARRLVDPANESAWKDLIGQMDDLSNAAKAHARELAAMDLFKDTPHVAAIGKISGEYDDRADQFLLLVRGGKLDEANRFNTAELRPCYDRYQLVLDGAAYYVQREGSDLRESYAKDSRLFGGFLLVFAGWPLLAAGILILMLGLLVVGLFITVFFPRLFAPRPVAA